MPWYSINECVAHVFTEDEVSARSAYRHNQLSPGGRIKCCATSLESRKLSALLLVIGPFPKKGLRLLTLHCTCLTLTSSAATAHLVTLQLGTPAPLVSSAAALDSDPQPCSCCLASVAATRTLLMQPPVLPAKQHCPCYRHHSAGSNTTCLMYVLAAAASASVTAADPHGLQWCRLVEGQQSAPALDSLHRRLTTAWPGMPRCSPKFLSAVQQTTRQALQVRDPLCCPGLSSCFSCASCSVLRSCR